MGALLTSRQNDRVEEIDVGSNHAYKYPPRTGNYFANHFIMGGERFDTPQPESYLFGENTDLNFLGSKPTPFPYPPPQPNEPTKTLKSLVNIRKESLRFVRAKNEGNKLNLNEPKDTAEFGTNASYNIEFAFDSDVSCTITIYYFCTEEFSGNSVTYVSRDPSLTSETFYYGRGSNQQFSQPSHVFNPARYADDDLLYDFEREIFPVVIHCIAEEGVEDMRQSHSTTAVVEKMTDGTYLLKALKQKLFVDGLCYLLQEVYGIENKNNDKSSEDDDTEDNGSECVICMCDVRDTLILPCRHLCLCNSCADSLRYQANNCPICRAPFRALLQIKALQKSASSNLAPISSPDGSSDNIPPGYEAVSLIEALNGPCTPRHPPSAMPDLIETPKNEHTQGVQMLNRKSDHNSPVAKKNGQSCSSEYEASLMAVRDENKEASQCPLLSEKSELKKSRPRDSLKLVNEKAEKDETMDEDSEAEKLSPLLQKTDGGTSKNVALHIAAVTDSIDDIDTDHEEVGIPEKIKIYNEHRNDSDYYTPDESASSVGPLSKDTTAKSLERISYRLPTAPLSYTSVRSKGESGTNGLSESSDKFQHI
ncbi:hypothetical protein NQ315_003766 [Exocentrus adspersus]|uniref:RING-type E3 ubiquitin transferase n=1 Tax=Exocentrus adspersus TaxID=1586481 RepID=A0AAV8VID6_9CUCU|nr:hypothetical protein NQ315_003766 [Exocentrus adspersus]